MDELESEWETKESPTGKLGWMMRLGRKLLVTGIVVASAPLVIPSIMVISAIGFVCSVPYGVLLVTYACTKASMSRLLPMPWPSARLLLEYDKAFGEEEEEEELREDRIGFVDKGYEELDKGDILAKGASEEYGVENDEKESVEQVGEIVEEGNGEFMNERSSESFEEVEQINGLQVEQPIIEVIWNEQPGDEGHGDMEAVVEGDEKRGGKIELGSENVEEKEELVIETRQSVENVDARKKRKKKKSKSKSEGTTKGKAEQSVEGSVSEQLGDKKGRDNENKQKTAELKNVAVGVENDVLVRNSRGSLERNGKEGTRCDAAEGKQGAEKEQVDAKVTKTKGDEGTRRKREQRLIEDSLAKQPVDNKVIGALGGLEGSEKKDKERSLIEESLAQQPVDDKVIGASGGLERSEKKDKEKRLIEESLSAQPLDDKAIGAFGAVEGSKKKYKETPLNVSESEEPMEEVCNIVVEFKGDEKNGSNIEQETLFHMKKVKQSTDIEEDKELVRETRGLVEKIRDEGKTSYVDDKPFDMLENSSTVSLQGSSPEVKTEESWPSSSYSVHQEASDSSELPTSIKALEADDVRVSSDNVIDAASDEAIQCEERIWEQMNALRTIVGYKAARKETCKEELKALYVFTGIEPPASLKDTSCDLTEVDAKLGFLKSVVGVK